MRSMAEADRYAVFGHPVSHSKSPQIHARFAGQTGEALSYQAIDVAPGSFETAVEDFFNAGGRGLNITVPYKEEAWQLAQHRSEPAGFAGAVNTLYCNEQGLLCGDNTDGVGLVRDITANHGFAISGRRVLLLGAGGAARGVLSPLLAQGPALLMIANRTESRAKTLVELASEAGRVGQGTCLAACSYDGLAKDTQARPYDLIINGTSAGLQGEVPPLPDWLVCQQTWCYDMVYGPGDTVFQAWGAGLGAARTLDGSGMLVEQAAESFLLWRGIRPDTAPVLQWLRTELGKTP